MLRNLLLLPLLLLAPLAEAQQLPPEQAALKAHVQFLAADALRGREGGTHEYDIAAQYVAAQMLDLRDLSHFHRFVYHGSVPSTLTPVKETKLQVRIPAAVTDGSPQIIGQSGDLVAVGRRGAVSDPIDLLPQIIGDPLVSVETQDPFV